MLRIFFNQPRRTAQTEAVDGAAVAVVKETVFEEFVAPSKEREHAPADFNLTRQDILDFAADAASNSPKYPVEVNTKLKSKPYFSDSLRCGKRCFGLMYESKDIIKLVLRMDKAFADSLQHKYAICY